MTALLIGYARVSTDAQDLPAQREGLFAHPVGRLLFNVLAMVAESEADLIRLRTREGMRVAKAKGRLRGKQPKLNPRQEAHSSASSGRANTAPPS